MISSKKLFAVLLAGIIFVYASSGPAAVVITTPGGGTGLDVANMLAYRSTNVDKTSLFDADDNDAYGTAGRYIFGMHDSAFADNSTFGPPNAQDYKPAWTNTFAAGAGYLSTAWAHPVYSIMDDPATPNNTPSATAWIAKSGVAYTQFGSTGDVKALFTFNMDASAPAAFRVGMITGNGDENNYEPSAITLSHSGGSSATISSLGNVATGEAGWVFFDVSKGPSDSGTFTVSLTLGTGVIAMFGGITFDELPVQVQDVPEPSTYALGLIGLAGLGLVAWRPRK